MQASRILRRTHGTYWRSRGSSLRYTPPGGVSVCDTWMQQHYILDKSEPVRMVFSSDLKAQDAFLVHVNSNHPDELGVLMVKAPGPHTRTVEITVTDALGLYLQKLRNRFDQGTIAVWFEQDWEE